MSVSLEDKVQQPPVTLAASQIFPLFSDLPNLTFHADERLETLESSNVFSIEW